MFLYAVLHGSELFSEADKLGSIPTAYNFFLIFFFIYLQSFLTIAYLNKLYVDVDTKDIFAYVMGSEPFS